jgi:hypothetical protein
MCNNVARGRRPLVARRRRRLHLHPPSQRPLPGASNLNVDWTLEAAADPRSVEHDPDPKNRSGAVRIIGYSPSAGFVITIIATGTTHAGVTAWKSSGADLRDYQGQG